MTDRSADLARAWVFGDNVDTDQMSPAATWALPWEKGRRMILAGHSRFAKEVAAGDVIVAGHNWGCGSSRESAPANLRRLGVRAVVAESFARIYFRNSIALGFPALAAPGASTLVQDGDDVVLDADSRRIVAVATGRSVGYAPLPEYLQAIVDDGGLMPRLARLAREGAL